MNDKCCKCGKPFTANAAGWTELQMQGYGGYYHYECWHEDHFLMPNGRSWVHREFATEREIALARKAPA